MSTGSARLLVVSGPIASGKSTVGLAAGAELERQGMPAAVVDLDLVYELLDPLRRPKTDAATWSEARRACGRIVGALLAERTAVVAEGDFRSARKRAELEETLPDGVVPVYVSLTVGYEEALRRAQADPTRGASQDPVFLSGHYDTVEAPLAGDLVLDTGTIGVAEAASAIVARAAAGTSGPLPNVSP